MQAAVVVVGRSRRGSSRRRPAGLEARAERDRLTAGSTAGLAETTVEPSVPLRETSPIRAAGRAPRPRRRRDRIAFLLGPVDLAIIAAAASPSTQRNRARLDRPPERHHSSGLSLYRGIADADHMTAYLDAGRGQEATRDGARRNPRCRSRRARALPFGTLRSVVRSVLERAGPVGRVPGAELQGAPALRFGRLRVRRHHVLPVLVVAVAEQERDRAACGPVRPWRTPTGSRSCRFFDLHAPASAIPARRRRRVRIHGGAVDGDTSGQAVYDDRQPGAVDSPAVGKRSMRIARLCAAAARCQGTKPSSIESEMICPPASEGCGTPQASERQSPCRRRGAVRAPLRTTDYPSSRR